MSTQINVTVGDQRLLQANKTRTAANQQSLDDRRSTQQLEQQAKNAAAAASPVENRSNVPDTRVSRRPAANRKNKSAAGGFALYVQYRDNTYPLLQTASPIRYFPGNTGATPHFTQLLAVATSPLGVNVRAWFPGYYGGGYMYGLDPVMDVSLSLAMQYESLSPYSKVRKVFPLTIYVRSTDTTGVAYGSYISVATLDTTVTQTYTDVKTSLAGPPGPNASYYISSVVGTYEIEGYRIQKCTPYIKNNKLKLRVEVQKFYSKIKIKEELFPYIGYTHTSLENVYNVVDAFNVYTVTANAPSTPTVTQGGGEQANGVDLKEQVFNFRGLNDVFFGGAGRGVTNNLGAYYAGTLVYPLNYASPFAASDPGTQFEKGPNDLGVYIDCPQLGYLGPQNIWNDSYSQSVLIPKTTSFKVAGTGGSAVITNYSQNDAGFDSEEFRPYLLGPMPYEAGSYRIFKSVLTFVP